MSRIGKLPISIPSGTNVTVNGQVLEAKGAKGTLSMTLADVITTKLEGSELKLMPREDLVEEAEAKMKAVEAKGKKITFASALNAEARTLWGTSRANAANMVQGVSEGFTRTLELVGVGYRAQMQGKTLKLALGFSHDVLFEAPEGVTIATPKPTEIVLTGIDKQVLGQVAAEIRAYRPPEPYKGKGVRYQGEFVRRKEGKKK